MSEELKPCPFCGGDARIIAKPYEPKVCVGCDDDTCLGFSGLGWLYDSEKEATEAWNRRAERTCRMEALLLREFATGRKHVTDTEKSDEELEMTLLELNDDTVIRCSNCHFLVSGGADVTYTQTDDGAWSVDLYNPRVSYCPHCGARVEVNR